MEKKLQLKVAALLEEIKRLNDVNAEYRASMTLLNERVEELVQEKEERADERRGSFEELAHANKEDSVS